MKKIIIISVLCLLVFSIQAQKPYSIENLQKLSTEELDVYYNKAFDLQKTGKILSIAGTVSAFTGVLLFDAAWSGSMGDEGTAALGGLMLLGGMGATIIGLPKLITGSSRLKRINDIISIADNNIKLDLKPSAQYNLATQNFQPAVTLCIGF